MSHFVDFCPCGWKLGSTKPHNHAARLRKFWEAHLARNPPKKFKGYRDRPRRQQRELRETVDAG